MRAVERDLQKGQRPAAGPPTRASPQEQPPRRACCAGRGGGESSRRRRLDRLGGVRLRCSLCSKHLDGRCRDAALVPAGRGADAPGTSHPSKVPVTPATPTHKTKATPGLRFEVRTATPPRAPQEPRAAQRLHRCRSLVAGWSEAARDGAESGALPAAASPHCRWSMGGGTTAPLRGCPRCVPLRECSRSDLRRAVRRSGPRGGPPLLPSPPATHRWPLRHAAHGATATPPVHPVARRAHRPPCWRGGPPHSAERPWPLPPGSCGCVLRVARDARRFGPWAAPGALDEHCGQA